MFTGIIETTGIIRSINPNGTNLDLWVESPITSELKIDQSLAHNGICLTVVDIRDAQYRVTAVAETIAKTTVGQWGVGKTVNLERALRIGDRLDGHFVQGHVDAIATCQARIEQEGSWLFSFQFPPAFAALVVEKGSICIDGVSLTAFNVKEQHLSVAIIPYTFSHTGFQHLLPGNQVNLEFDVLGKYLLRSQSMETNR